LPTVTITADYDAYPVYQIFDGAYVKYENQDDVYVGYYGGKFSVSYRGCFSFNLASLPADATVTQVRRRINCGSAGGANFLSDDHAYGSNGQENPASDDGETCYNRCASGNLYQNDSTELRTTGVKWAVLGGTICQDVQNAKATVNRFALAIHEEGDDDPFALIDGHSKVGGMPPQIEITYTQPTPPSGGYQYSDGLVCVQVG